MQSIRFRSQDLLLIRKAAKRADERISPWIRAVVLEKTDRVLSDRKTSSLVLVPAGEEIMCIRFRPLAMERVARAAQRKKVSVTDWIRSIAVAAAQ